MFLLKRENYMKCSAEQMFRFRIEQKAVNKQNKQQLLHLSFVFIYKTKANTMFLLKSETYVNMPNMKCTAEQMFRFRIKQKGSQFLPLRSWLKLKLACEILIVVQRLG